KSGSQIRSSGIRDTIHPEKKLTVEVKYSYKTILKIAALVIPSIILGWFLKPDAPPPQPKPANKMVVPLPEDISFNFSMFNMMAISPDGTNMVYLARRAGRRLFLKRAGSFETNELAGTDRAQAPFFSPDGRWIGYFNPRTEEINKVLIDGGAPLRITSFNGGQSSATWAPDNTIIFADDDVLKRVPESGGEPDTLTKTKEAGEQHQFPHMLPDGKTVLFTVTRMRRFVAGGQDAELSAYRLAVYGFGDDDYRVILDEEGYNAVYSPTGHILYGRSQRLMAVPFDLKNLRISGVPAPVLDKVQTHDLTGSMSYALSKEGTIIYVPGKEAADDVRSVLNVDLSGNATEFFDLKKRFTFVRYSPDGEYLAFWVEEDNVNNIWIYHIEGGAINQLTFYKEGGVGFFAWSPDSKRLAYATTAEDSTSSIYSKRIDGIGTAQKIYTSSSAEAMVIYYWSNDGDMVAFSQSVSGNMDIFVYSFQDSSAKPFVATPAFEAGASFSPNGKWVVYSSNVSAGFGGGQEVYVRPYPESSGGVWKISNGGGSQAVWSRDGKKIYYRKNG
ncbi:MAG: TolB family protein, partial [Desulfobacterales bacterium]